MKEQNYIKTAEKAASNVQSQQGGTHVNTGSYNKVSGNQEKGTVPENKGK